MTGVLVVTGASRGIGAAIARAGGASGYKVAVNYARGAEAARAVVGEIERAGGKAITVQANVSREKDIVDMFRTVDAKLGPVTALVNNAGQLGMPSPVSALTPDAVDALLHVNITSQFICAREAIRRMSPEAGGKGGAIVNIGSVAARIGGFPKCVAYAASKGAIDSFTIGLAKEVAPLNIRVNCVRPGLTETDILDAAGGADAVAKIAAATVPLGGRMAKPAEIANMVIWLLSDKASYVTGAIYDVAGGR